MSNVSKAKMIADCLEASPDRWHTWHMILESLISDFSEIDEDLQITLMRRRSWRIPEVRVILRERGEYLLKMHWGLQSEYKVAGPDDMLTVIAQLQGKKKNVDNAKGGLMLDVRNLKEKGVLPRNYDIERGLSAGIEKKKFARIQRNDEEEKAEEEKAKEETK